MREKCPTAPKTRDVGRSGPSIKGLGSMLVSHQLSLVHLEPAGDARQTLDQRQGGPLHPEALQDRTEDTSIDPNVSGDARIRLLFPQIALLFPMLTC